MVQTHPIQEQEITLVVYVDSFCQLIDYASQEALRNVNQVRFKNVRLYAVGFEKGIVLEANLPFMKTHGSKTYARRRHLVFGVKAIPFEQKMLKRVRLGDLLCAGGIWCPPVVHHRFYRRDRHSGCP